MSPPCEDFLTADRLAEPERYYPLDVRICGACLLVQLPAYIAPEDIFGEYFYFSSYSDSWVDHARRYVDAVVERFGLGPSSRVIEVASNDGYSSALDRARNPGVGVEPARNIAAAAEAAASRHSPSSSHRGLAQEIVARDGRADLVVANNVSRMSLTSTTSPPALRILLAPGVLTIEVAHLSASSSRTSSTRSTTSTSRTARCLPRNESSPRHGLRVFDVEELATHGGSLRFFVVHDDDRPSTAAAVDELA